MAETNVSSSRPLVRFIGVRKTFDGRTLVVRNLDLDVLEGEFLTLLGPSGSGKTTTLMMLAGFETPTAGEITLAGRSLAHLPPHKRDIGVVFQNYALFPHMTVDENIAFPLQVRKIPPAEIQARIRKALEMVQLSGFAFPIRNMPLPVQWVAELIPATHYIRVSRAIYLRGAGPLDLWFELLLLLGFGALLVGVSLRALSRRA